MAARLDLAILLDLYLHDPAAALPHYKAVLATGTVAEMPRWIAELERQLARS